MSTEQIWRTESTSLEHTLQLAEQLGSKVRGGEIFRLVSDLGGGKTAFVRGLAKGMHCTDLVSSPSFTISNEYQGQSLRLYHFDFYRLQEAGIMKQELAEIESDSMGVVAVEWADIVARDLPIDHIVVKIVPLTETSRAFEFTYTQKFSYLFPNT